MILTDREEQGMIKQLEDKKVPLNKIEYVCFFFKKKRICCNMFLCGCRVNPNYIHDLTPKLQALCAQFPELKEQAKRVSELLMDLTYSIISLFYFEAFTSYLRSLILMGNRKVFDVKSIDTDAFATYVIFTVSNCSIRFAIVDPWD